MTGSSVPAAAGTNPANRRARTLVVGLRLRVRAWGNRARESLFFVPGLLIAAGAAAAVGAIRADHAIGPVDVPHALRISPGAANVLLATIAGATITTVGVVFSITVVSVQLASGQFSPRVVRGFFRDRYGQVVIGVLAATFAFCVLSMFGISPVTAAPARHLPVTTTGVAVLLAFASIVTIVIYLDHSARSLYVGTIADRVMDESLAMARQMGSLASAGQPVEAPSAPGHVVRSRGGSGWVQQVSDEGLLAAVPPGSIVRLETRPGAYISTGTPLAAVWPPPDDTDEVERDVNRAVVLGAERTMQQDLDFGLRQLTDIGLRALSPAVNDPTTAVEVVVRVGSILHDLLDVDLAPTCRTDASGTVLLRPLELTHADYVRHGFLQLRRAAVEHPVVVVALVRTLRMLQRTAAARGRVEAADTAEQMIDGCLQLADRVDLLDDERAMIHQAAQARTPAGPRRRSASQTAS